LRGVQIVEDWMQRMVSDTRSFGERMAVFWHGHLCSEFSKAGVEAPMREQIDLYRRHVHGGRRLSLQVLGRGGVPVSGSRR
jgi:uncharacterized protein (DUF1800 family)